MIYTVSAIILVGLVTVKGSVDYRIKNVTQNSSEVCKGELHNGYGCINCSMLVYCLNSTKEMIIGRCPDGKLCIGGRCVTTSSCPYQDVPFICSNAGVFPDPVNCTKYHICTNYNSSLKNFEQQCEGNENGPKYGFNPKKLECSDKLTDGQCQKSYVPECKKVFDEGVIPHTSIYYYCNYYIKENGKLDTNILYPYQNRCDNGKIYNITVGKCT